MIIEHIIALFWLLSERSICFLIGVSFILLSAITWYIQKESRIGNGLYDIAAAIREKENR